MQRDSLRLGLLSVPHCCTLLLQPTAPAALGAVTLQEACAEASCRCRPADISAEWDTRQEGAAAPARSGSGASGVAGSSLHPPAYARAVRHYAHLLQASCGAGVTFGFGGWQPARGLAGKSWQQLLEGLLWLWRVAACTGVGNTS